MLTFEPITHTYTLGERKLPGVTSLLKAFGFIDDSWASAEALQRGTFVHEAAQYDDEGKLDPASLDERLRGYVEAWRRCKREIGLEVVECERHVAHPLYGYAGTLDRIVNRVLPEGTFAYLVDLKTGGPQPWHSLQVGFYAMAWEAQGVNPVRLRRACAYLAADGKYKFVEYTDRNDYAVAKALLTLAAWKEKNG